MATTESILSLIYAAVDDVNSMLPVERRLAKSPETLILGQGSSLGSLGLVHLVVAIEDRIQATYHHAPTLMDDILGPDTSVRTLGELSGQIQLYLRSSAS